MRSMNGNGMVCPICKAEVPKSINNMVAQRAYAFISRKCLQPGCSFIGNLVKMDDHLETCEFVPYHCPVFSCNWSGPGFEVGKHFIEGHGVTVVHPEDLPTNRAVFKMMMPLSGFSDQEDDQEGEIILLHVTQYAALVIPSALATSDEAKGPMFVVTWRWGPTKAGDGSWALRIIPLCFNKATAEAWTWRIDVGRSHMRSARGSFEASSCWNPGWSLTEIETAKIFTDQNPDATATRNLIKLMQPGPDSEPSTPNLPRLRELLRNETLQVKFTAIKVSR